MNEKLYPIKGCNRKYAITKSGKVWSYHCKRFLKSAVSNRGYCRVAILKGNERKNLSIHRLVAETFIKNPENKKTVNHVNGIKTDNRVENLEWATHSENKIHSIEIGSTKIFYGEKNSNSKLKDIDILEIRKLLSTGLLYHREIASLFNVSKTTITNISNNKYWNHVV